MNSFIATYFFRIKRKDILFFFSQLTVLYTAGITLNQCLSIIASYQANTSLKPYLKLLMTQLSSGQALAKAFSQYPQCFDQTTCQLLELGQETGKLTEALANITRYHEYHLNTQRELKNALFYPGIILILSTLILSFLLLFIVPKFSSLYQTSTATLPVMTKLLFSIAIFFKQYIALILLFIVTIIILFIAYYQLFFTLLRKLLIRLPLIKSFYQKIILVQFTRHLQLAFSAGLPIDQAIKLAANSISYSPFKIAFSRLAVKIQTGQSLYSAMQSLVLFPDFFCDMIKTGEESGQLELMLSQATQLIEFDIKQSLYYLKQSAEPLIMTMLGVVIGLVILCLYLPIFNLGTILQ